MIASMLSPCELNLVDQGKFPVRIAELLDNLGTAKAPVQDS